MMQRNIRHPLCMLTLALLLLPGCDKATERAGTDAGPVEPEAVQHLAGGAFPTTALDAHSGGAYLVFFRTEAEQTDVYLARREAGSAAWSEPVRVNSMEGEANAHAQAPAQVAVGPGGEVYVAWTNAIPVEGRRFPASNLYFARSTDGGRTFSAQRAVNSDADGLPAGHTFHDLAVGPDGTIYVSWLDGRDKEAATRAAEGTVQPVSVGHHASHHGADEPGTQVWVATSHDGGETFSAGTVVADGSCQCCRTSLVVAQDGTVYLAWRHIYPGGERDIALAKSTDGGATFSEPARVYRDGWAIDGCPHAGPSLAIDTEGRVHIAWYTGAEAHPGLFYAVSEDGGRQFSAPHTLAANVPVSQVKLAGNREERIWVAWEDAAAQQIRLAYTQGGAPLAEVEGARLEGETPAVAAVEGRWMVVGQEETGAVALQGGEAALD